MLVRLRGRVRVHVSVCVCVHMHVRLHARSRVRVRVCVRVRVRAHVRVRVRVRERVRVRACTCTGGCMHVRAVIPLSPGRSDPPLRDLSAPTPPISDVLFRSAIADTVPVVSLRRRIAASPNLSAGLVHIILKPLWPP